MNDYPGILIAIDGIDGAGKTTQVRLLESAMLSVGEVVLVSKEPTDGEWGQKLRDSALKGRMPVEQELDAFIRDRQDHLKKKVIPALEAGSVVILDRYFYSTIAYQGILLADHTTIEQRIRADVVVPDAAYWLDLSADVAVSRVTARDGQPNLFERQEDLARAREIFRAISASDSKLRRIDGTMSVQSLHQQIVDDLVSGSLKDKRCRKSYGCDDPIYCTPRLTNTCKWWSIKRQLTQGLATLARA
jgi:dTMP kinase